MTSPAPGRGGATTPRPLPTVIGPTENALRTLLVRLLDGSPITTYEQWVAINGIARPGQEDPLGMIAEGLQRPRADVAEVLEALRRQELVGYDGPGWRLTAPGAELLSRLRAEVGAATARLLDGIDEHEVAIARRVLDTVRERAIGELDRRPIG